jgi:hypothetical protein
MKTKVIRVHKDLAEAIEQISNNRMGGLHGGTVIASWEYKREHDKLQDEIYQLKKKIIDVGRRKLI